MNTMDKLLAKLKADGYITAAIELYLNEYRKLQCKARELRLNLTMYGEAIRCKSFLWGTIWALSMIGYINDYERMAIVENLEEGGEN